MLFIKISVMLNFGAFHNRNNQAKIDISHITISISIYIKFLRNSNRYVEMFNKAELWLIVTCVWGNF